jgi:hypothetical protein
MVTVISLCVLWRRRADSNRRIEVLQTPALDRLATSPYKYFSGAEEETRTPTAYSATAPSTLRVYQFHHLGLIKCPQLQPPWQKIIAMVRLAVYNKTH